MNETLKSLTAFPLSLYNEKQLKYPYRAFNRGILQGRKLWNLSKSSSEN